MARTQINDMVTNCIPFSEILPKVCFFVLLLRPLSFENTSVVGLEGLEPSTLRLSGVYSKPLSYKPFKTDHTLLPDKSGLTNPDI